MSAQEERERKIADRHIVGVVRGHLRANGDWNLNDWRDIAELLARRLEARLEGYDRLRKSLAGAAEGQYPRLDGAAREWARQILHHADNPPDSEGAPAA